MPSALDAEPNNTIEEAEGGGLLSWPDNARIDLPFTVHAGFPGFYHGGDPYDPSDWVKISLGVGAQTVILRPFIDDYELVAQLERPGVAGAFATVWFTPAGMFTGASVCLIAKIGDAAHDYLSSPGGAYYELDLLLTQMQNRQQQNNSEGVVDAALNADVNRTQGIIALYFALQELDGVNCDSNAVAQLLSSAAVGGGSPFSPQINAWTLELANAAADWDVVHYYLVDPGTIELTPIDPFIDLGPLSEGFAWNVVDHPSSYGYVEISGEITVSVHGPGDIALETYAVSTFGSSIAFGTGSIPSSTVFSIDQDVTLVLDDAATSGHTSLIFDASVLTSAHQLALNASGVTTAELTIVGGLGADTISGGTRDDTFTGRAGNDVLIGGVGVDRATYGLASTAATWVRNPDGTWTVTAGGDGTDTLTSVEYLDFTDRDVFLDRPARTFSGDGTSDILWQRNDGLVVTWSLLGSALTGSGSLGAVGAEWSLLGSGDFNGDGRDDILWRRNDGLVSSWNIDGGARTSAGTILSPGLEWSFLGIGDFNGDGRDDIAWRRNDGLIVEWQMNGRAIGASAVLPQLGAEWTLKGLGDFNGDGRDDFLWQRNDGLAFIWGMNGGTIATAGPTSAQPGLAWHIVAVGDTNGDGRDDIIWQNDNGTIVGWQMNGTAILTSGLIGSVSPTQWDVAGMGDYNGDGRDDLLLQNTNGAVVVWILNGNLIQQSGLVGSTGAEWDIIGGG